MTYLPRVVAAETRPLSGTHAWVHSLAMAYLPGALTPAVEQASAALLAWLQDAGCVIESEPSDATEVLLTTARFGVPVLRDEAPFFQAKRRFGLGRRPRVVTIVSIRETEYQAWLDHFAGLAQLPEDAETDRQYPGLGPHAVEVLRQQAKRGGPEVALGRFLQAQSKSIQVIALRSDNAERPICGVHFDLAGAHPVTDAADLDVFARDAGLRLLTASCAHEVNRHVFLPEPLPRRTWDDLATPDVMVRAGRMFTEFGFFTEPVYIEKLLGFRGVSDAISAQYSEGCYAVFDPDIPGLVTTASGSSRLVDKRSIRRDDQAIVVGVKPERDGAFVRTVEGVEASVPSVEAVEMMGICQSVPKIRRVNRFGGDVQVPSVRAILHGHIGVEAFDPDRVESVRLAPTYYTHLVSCGTGELAEETMTAFARSKTLADPADPRMVVFLEQPGHGLVVAEKWVEGKTPFEAIYDCLAAGHLKVTMQVSQGSVEWETHTPPDGRRMTRKVT